MAIKPVSSKPEYPYVVMRLDTLGKLDADTFFDLAQANQDLRMELSSQGDLIVMPPAGGLTGRRNARLTRRLDEWAEKDGQGDVFDSSTGFQLPSGAVRSPDTSWVSKTKLAELNNKEMKKFPPICPEFVLELRSDTDRLSVVKEKMQEYVENGAELGWLIDPQERRVYIYTGEGVQELEQPQEVIGTGVLEGFRLELSEIW